MYPERYSVLLSNTPTVSSTDETGMGAAEYRGTLLVKLFLDPSQITTVGYRNRICLNSQISANDVYGVYVESLFPSYKFKLFLNQPANTENLQLDEIAIFMENNTFYYMLKGDEFPMPVLESDMDSRNNIFPQAHFLSNAGNLGYIQSNMSYLYTHRTDGATLEGHVLSHQFMTKRPCALDASLGLIAAIAKNDRRINAHGQLDDLFPINITCEFPLNEINSQASSSFGFFSNLEQQAVVPPIEGLLKKEITLYCPVTQKPLQNPLFNIQDGLVYSSDAKQKKSEISHDGKEKDKQNTILFSDYFTNSILEANEIDEELIICPITQEIMQKPVFCILDNRTYEESAIINWLAKTRTSPINRNAIPEGVEPKDVVYSHKLAEHVIADLQQEAEYKLAIS